MSSYPKIHIYIHQWPSTIPGFYCIASVKAAEPKDKLTPHAPVTYGIAPEYGGQVYLSASIALQEIVKLLTADSVNENAPVTIHRKDGDKELRNTSTNLGMRPFPTVDSLRWIDKADRLPSLEKCEHVDGRSKAHTCPYLEDLNGDTTTKCRCCDGCQKLCAENL